MEDNTLRLEQLIPLEKLRSALKRFCTSAGVGCIIMDPRGEVMIEEGSPFFCKKNHSEPNQPTFQRCSETEHCFAENLPNSEHPSLVTCNNGFSSITAPIVIDGLPIASIFIGLFFLFRSDRERHKEITTAKGGEETACRAALAQTPLFSTEKVQLTISHLELFVDLVSAIGRNLLLERQANRQLKKSEERYRNMINSLPQGIYETDAQGKLTFANPSAHESFGYAPQEPIDNINIIDFIPQRDHEKAATRLKRLLSGETLEPEEYSFRRKDGSFFPAMVSSRSIDTDGEVRGVRGIILDISHRKKAEKKLQESELRYRTLFEGANDAILIIEHNTIINCNDKALQMFQRSRQELIGASPVNLSPPLQPDGQLSTFKAEITKAAVEKGIPQFFEWNFCLPDGPILETEVSLSRMDIAGRPMRQAILRDIRERNRSRRIIEERESAWRAIFQHAPFGIAINRMSDGVYLDVNPAYEISSGRKAADIIGKAPQVFLPPSEHVMSLEATETLQQSGCISNQEAAAYKADGTIGYVLYSAATFEAGEERFAVSMFVDITERKKMEEKLQRNEATLRSLFQAVPVGLTILQDRTFRSINERLCEITGYDAATLLRQTTRHLYESDEEYDRVGSALYDSLAEQRTSYVETRFVHRDGSLRTVSLFAAPLVPHDPSAGVAAAIQDITEQKTMIQALRDSEELFRKTADFSGQLIYDYNVGSRAILWSGRVPDITGYSFEEMNSFGISGWSERVHPEDRDDIMVTMGSARQEQTVFAADYRFRKADDTYMHVYEEGAYLYDTEGKAIRMLGTIKDITSQKRAEDALRRSEERYSVAINATSVAIWDWSPQSGTAYFSPRYYEMLGYSDQEFPMSIEAWAKLCHPDDYQTAINLLQQALPASSDRGFTYEFRMRRRDGTWGWILSRGKVTQRDEAGNPLLLAGTNTDISQRKIAELALKASEERYRTLFEGASDAILIVEDNIIINCNQKTLEMFRCSRQEIIGLSPSDISSTLQSDGRNFTEKGNKYIAKALLGQQQKFEWLNSRFDGTLFHAEVSLNAIELSGKQFLQAIIRDITERKKAERAVKESEFRFRSFFNTNPAGIVLIDFQGILLDVNKAFLQESGYSITECAHKHFKEFIPEEDQVRIVEAILSLKSGLSQNDQLKFSYIAKNGSIVPVAAKGWLVMDEHSVPLYLGVFIRNLTKELALTTEKATLEKQVIQAQKSEAIGTLAGGIAHDFNNILGGIIGYTELALYRDPSTVDKKIREYLERVLESGNRAKSLIQQILRFSRHSNMVMEPMCLSPVIKESIRLLRSTLPTTIEIRQQLDLSCDRILGDPTQIHQVVMNLATNAYHAMRDTGGLLTISLKNLTLTAPRQFMSMTIPPGQYLMLRVTDTGSGIKPAVLERIFEPYFTTKDVNEGNGLGMAVVMGIVKSHKGLIEIETDSVKGTSFDVFLPLTQSKATEKNADEINLPLGHGERVLIVDDEAFFLEVVAESLKLLGYQVTASQSSLATLKTFRDNPQGYDLLITDQTMPEMTGVQLTQEVRRISTTIPIILCTGYSETVTEQSAGYYGITGFLMKPVNIHDLAKAIDGILSKRIVK